MTLGFATAALAAMLVHGQVATSSIAYSPQACRDYRAAAYLWRGVALAGGVDAARAAGDLADAEASFAVIEAAALAPPASPEPPPWHGWPWVALVAGAALGATLAIVWD